MSQVLNCLHLRLCHKQTVEYLCHGIATTNVDLTFQYLCASPLSLLQFCLMMQSGAISDITYSMSSLRAGSGWTNVGWAIAKLQCYHGTMHWPTSEQTEIWHVWGVGRGEICHAPSSYLWLTLAPSSQGAWLGHASGQTRGLIDGGEGLKLV